MAKPKKEQPIVNPDPKEPDPNYMPEVMVHEENHYQKYLDKLKKGK